MSAGRTRIEFEALSSMLDDGLMDLLEADYEEVEATPFALDVDWDNAFALERQGLFKAISVRNPHLIGYAAFHIQQHFHCRSIKSAFNDVIYLHPTFRGAIGLRLIARSEELLRSIGVNQVFISSKEHSAKVRRTGDLLKELGYTNTERTWRKLL